MASKQLSGEVHPSPLPRFTEWAQNNTWAIMLAFIVLLNLAYCMLLYKSLSVLFVGLIFPLIVVALYVSFPFLKRKGFSQYGLFAATLASLGFFYIVIFPPFLVPDSLYHYESAYQYSNCLLFLFPIEAESMFMRDIDKDFMVNHTFALSNGFYHSIANQLMLPAESNEINWADLSGMTGNLAPTLLSNPPQLRLPSALGIAVARLLGLNPLLTFYAGELCTLSVFVTLMYFTVKLAPIGKPIFVIGALLPMTLHVAGSYSYDSTIIGMAFLLSAFLLKMIYRTDPIEKHEVIVSLAIMALLAPCKVVYFFIGLLAFMVPTARFSSIRSAYLYRFAMIGVSLLFIGFFRLDSIAALVVDPETQGEIVLDKRGTEEGHFYSISDLVSDPLATIGIMVRTLFETGDHNLRTLIGGSLGWFDGNIGAPWFFVISFLLLVLMAMLPTPDEPKTNFTSRLAFGGVALIVIACVEASMLLGWTFTTESVIQGVQGRYFLPILPLALLALRPKTIVSEKVRTSAIMLAIALLNTSYLTYIFAKAMSV